jgi:catechol-2,3-dioxygenase
METMQSKLLRVGTTYLPVRGVERAAEWYVSILGAQLSYQDNEKAIVNLADQSFFLVKAKTGESSNFEDDKGEERFSLTFEVDGLGELENLHRDLFKRKVRVGELEDRGHTGRNFVFYDLDGNKFDVWSELSPAFKGKME